MYLVFVIEAGVFIKHIILFLLIFSTSSLALAKTNCSLLLSGQKTYQAIDYMVSDVEGLFLEIASDAIHLAEVKSTRAADSENFLLKKAFLLNQMGSLVGVLRHMHAQQISAPISLLQISNMLFSLGVHPKSYGIELDKNKKLHFKGLKITNEEPSKQNEFIKAKIGFIYNDGDESLELPDGFFRSIGFETITIRQEEAPRRKGGQIYLSSSNESNLSIKDLENLKIMFVPKKIMSLMKVKTDSKEMIVDYDSENNEWLVRFANLSNPNGEIGFYIPSKH